jgi:hypothetical protein
MLARAGWRSALFLVFIAGLTGCRHKTLYVLPQQVAMAPIDLEPVPEPKSPPMISSVPEPQLPPPSPAAPPRVTRRRPAQAKEPPPVQVASAPEPAALAIGALSSGGDSTPQSQQDAKDLIASIQKRIAALPSKTASQQKEQLRQVLYFLKQAQQALNTGDAEGAKNLATKAKLLMDDVEKK